MSCRQPEEFPFAFLPLKVPVVAVGRGEGRHGGHGGRDGRADLGRVRLQPSLVVLHQLAHDDPAEVLVVLVAVVQQLADLGGARGLVDHQFVILAHQHGAGEQRVQALVQTSLRHLEDDVLAPRGDPVGDGAPGGRGLVQGGRALGCHTEEGGGDFLVKSGESKRLFDPFLPCC